MDVKEQYSVMFTNYPDIINIEQMRNMLGGISLTLAYRLIKENKIKAMKIGRQYKIPKANIISYYNKAQLNELLVAIKDTPIKLPVFLALYYGLRRSEALGIKWDAVDFENKTIIIRHTISQTKVDGKLQIVAEDKTKNQSSYRTLPLIPEIEEILLEEKANQEYNKKVFKKSYLNDNGYVCVNADGSILKPDYVSHKFNQILKDNNLKSIRFHDLRHSCASLLLSNKVSMKDIQIWLGHSSYNTTANIYTHVDVESKQNSALVIGSSLNFTEPSQDDDEEDEEMEL